MRYNGKANVIYINRSSSCPNSSPVNATASVCEVMGLRFIGANLRGVIEVV